MRAEVFVGFAISTVPCGHSPGVVVIVVVIVVVRDVVAVLVSEVVMVDVNVDVREVV